MECKINPQFLSKLNAYYDLNANKFSGGAVQARQYIFNAGIKKVSADPDGVMIPRALGERKDFLDPQNRSVSVIVDKISKTVLENISPWVNGHEAVPVVLKIGYDVNV